MERALRNLISRINVLDARGICNPLLLDTCQGEQGCLALYGVNPECFSQSTYGRVQTLGSVVCRINACTGMSHHQLPGAGR